MDNCVDVLIVKLISKCALNMPVCKQCKYNINKRNKQLICVICNQIFHQKCTEVSDEEFKLLSNKSSVRYICDDCNITQLTYIQQLVEEMHGLKKSMKICLDAIEQNNIIVKELE